MLYHLKAGDQIKAPSREFLRGKDTAFKIAANGWFGCLDGSRGRLYADDVGKSQRQQLLYERSITRSYIEGARPARQRV